MYCFAAFSLLLLSEFASAATLAARNNFQANCKEVTFTVFGSAVNKNITGIPLDSLSALVAFYQSAGGIPISGNQTLAGTYCTPLSKNANNNKLEGFITDNRGGWQAIGGIGTDFPQYNPEKYSWSLFANFLGYPTLAMDKLGSGRSSHPDPVLVVQAPYEVSLYSNLAKQIIAGTTGQLPRSYSDLTYIGNSYGSQLGVALAYAKAPYTRYLLTGFTDDFQQDFVGVALTDPAPAAVVDPARFGNLSPGYVTTSSQTGRTNSFFGSPAQVDFEPEVSALWFQRKDVVSVGQYVSVYAIPYEAPNYTGRVLVLDGENDQATCGPGSPVIGPANCAAEMQPSSSKSIFPAAQYDYQTVARTGHAIQLHNSSYTVYAIAHEWLAGFDFHSD